MRYKSTLRLPEPADNTEILISEVLYDLGMPAKLTGFLFCREAIRLSMTDWTYFTSVTKKLYPTLAETFGSTTSCVERNIRHAIEMLWNRGDNMDALERYFRNTVSADKGRPTNSEFIAMVTEWIRLRKNEPHGSSSRVPIMP